MKNAKNAKNAKKLKKLLIPNCMKLLTKKLN